jgi:N-formylglutamate deformylase
LAAGENGDDRPPDRADCYAIHYPRSHPAPLIMSSPHSGRVYTPEFIGLSRLALPGLRRSEDCFIDELFASGPDFGATLIAARFPRAWCDANREAWELDPSMFEDPLPEWVNTSSPRVAAGLGTIARVVSNGEAIYRGTLRFADARDRVATCWQPYHDALAQLVAAARARHGACLLLDCHSMPAHACRDRRPVPDIVLGDVHGAACAPAVLRRVESFLVERRYAVRRNDPYAGGYITRHYGRPAADCHALQIEVARGLYMDEANLTKSPGFGRVAADLRALAEMLSDELPELLVRDRSLAGGGLPGGDTR